MIPFVERFNPSEWREYSEQAHSACFGTFKPVQMDRIDFALVVRTEKDLLGYVTCKELDHETLYWQFGGAFPGTRFTTSSWKAFLALTQYCSDKYKRLTFRVENDNGAMLKFAAKSGFKIVGCRFFQGTVLLEHLLEFNKGDQNA